MKKETIMKAVKVINRNIKFYQRKLTYQLELRAEAKFNNGNLKVANLGNYESNITKYEIILADLATIKKAIKNNQTSVKIFGTAESKTYIYMETSKVLEEAGFDYDGDGYGEIFLTPMEDLKEELTEGTPECWSAYGEEEVDELILDSMATFEDEVLLYNLI